MKILFQGYNTCCQNLNGGVQQRIRKIKELLKNKNIKVDFFDPFTTKVSEYDILHIFQVNVENLGLIQCAKKNNVKVVLSSIVPLTDKLKLTLYKLLSKFPITTAYKIEKNVLKLADLIITESKQESIFLSKIYGVELSKTIVIPNGYEGNNALNSEIIFDAIGNRSEYALMVGRFDKNKNQLNVIKALKDTDVQLVLIGGADHTNSSYYDKCLEESKGHNNIHFLGWVDSKSELLISAYSNAKVVISASHYETFGLTIIEGGAAGANLALSKTLPILDYGIFSNCALFNPNSVKEIRKAVENSMAQPKSDALQDKIKKCFSWDSVIQQHIDLYSGLLR